MLTKSITRHEANKTLLIFFFFSRRCKFVRWPWSLPAQCLLLITCHQDTCCSWQLVIRKSQNTNIQHNGQQIAASIYHQHFWILKARIISKLIFFQNYVLGGRKCLGRPRKLWELFLPRAQRRKDQSQCHHFLTWWPMSKKRWGSVHICHHLGGDTPRLQIPERKKSWLSLHIGNVVIRQLRGSRLQLSILLEPPLFLSTHLHLGR